MRKGFLPPLVQINILKDLPIHHTLTFEKSEMLEINKRISGISSKQERKGVGGKGGGVLISEEKGISRYFVSNVKKPSKINTC